MSAGGVATVLVGGDLCPVGRNEPLFRRGDAAGLFHDLLAEFGRADIAVVNLECPLIRENTPILKTGPVLGAGEESITGIRAAGIDILALANNHIMDHGPAGLANTLRVCRESKVAAVGAGDDLAAARTILVRELEGVRVGFLAMAEHEFSIADEDNPGSNPLDVIDFVRNVRENRSRFDVLVVILHAGNEQYPYPRPRLMDTCRFLVEQGANAVVCQHSHCAGAMEMYRGAPIVYGQGNLLFDLPSRPAGWYTGFLLCLSVERSGVVGTRVVPFVQSREEAGTRGLAGDEERVFRAGFEERSAAIASPAFVRAQWERFCAQNGDGYLLALFGHGRVTGRLNRWVPVLRVLHSRRELRTCLNLVRCESHREALLRILSAGAGGGPTQEGR